MNEQVIQLDTGLVHLWESGVENGHPLLLLHGGFGDAWAQWADVIPLLAQTYHVIAPDFPGYGGSESLSPLRYGTLLNWLHALLDALEIHQVVVIGQAFGGLMARLLAAASPTRVAAVILINGGVLPHIALPAQIIARIPGVGNTLLNRVARTTTSRATLEEAFNDQTPLTETFVDNVRHHSGALARIMRMMTTQTVPAENCPRVPTLLLWGESDTLAPFAVAEYIQSEIPGAQIAPLAECGHMPHVETPDVLATQIEFFLRNIDRTHHSLHVGKLDEPG